MAIEPPKTRTAPPAEQPPPRAPAPAEISPPPRNPAAPARPAERGPAPAPAPGLLAALERIERLLIGLHAHSEATVRRGRHKEFSPTWLIGGVLQVITLGAILAAAADWVYDAGSGPTLVKLAFAGVFQLSALTAFVLARGPGGSP